MAPTQPTAAAVVHDLPVQGNYVTALEFVQLDLYVYDGRLSSMDVVVTPLVKDATLEQRPLDALDPDDFSIFGRLDASSSPQLFAAVGSHPQIAGKRYFTWTIRLDVMMPDDSASVSGMALQSS